jgi:hypothetical protein
MGLHIDSCGWFPCAIDKDYAFGGFQVGSLGKNGRYQVVDHGFDISFFATSLHLSTDYEEA